MRRRHFLLSSVGVGTISGTSLKTLPVRATQEPQGTVVFEDQTSDATSITVAEMTLNIDGHVAVHNLDKDQVIARSDIAAGDYQNYTIELDQLLRKSATLEVRLHDQAGIEFADDTAMVQVAQSVQIIDEISPTLIAADSDAGFNYPYYLWAPAATTSEAGRPIMVKPNNSPNSTDDFERHKSNAREDITSGPTRRVAEELRAPYLIPVFPRPRSEPVDFTHLIHQLDDTTLAIEDGPLKRVDLQLNNMIDHAQQYLRDRDYPIDDSGVMMDGFSASGNFAERFATLHPEEVISVTAGGLNGMPILPLDQTVGHTLDYHLGTANIKALTGTPFDLDGFREVNRFLYMGEFDDSDTIPYGDAWTNDDLREAALDVFGNHMVYDRFAYANAVYDDLDTNAVFRVYDGWHHTPEPAEPDIIEFHKRSIAGESGQSIRQDLGGNVPELGANIEYGARDPAPGEQVTFDGRRSAIKGSKITDYAWDFGDGTTATGEKPTHTFDTRGGHMVTLTVTDAAGRTHQTVEPVVVRPNPDADTRSSIEFLETPRASDDVAILQYSLDQDATSRSILSLRVDGAEMKFFSFVRPGQSRRKAVIRFLKPPQAGTTLPAAITPQGSEGIDETAFARTETTVEPGVNTEDLAEFGPTHVEANSDAGFNYPYYLYAPARSSDEPAKPLLVEPNNSPNSTNDFETHRRFAKRLIQGGFGPALADGLSTPFLVPVFPRPDGDPVDDIYSIQMLDDMTMRIESGPLKRVDLQLLRMAEDARQRLRNRDYPVADGLMLNGFSASGNFSERFAALHPNEVVSVTAGGLNGMPILPRTKAVGRSGNTHTLEYHLGVADVKSLTGEPFDLEAFRNVNRFLYMGEIDVSDTIPYNDAWTRDALQQAALDVYGRDMQEERFQYSRAVYEAFDVNAVFRIYEETGHNDVPAFGDILEFHRRSLAGGPIDQIRADLGGNAPNERAHIELAPVHPTAGDRIAAHATRTKLRQAAPTGYQWEFGDGTTYTGAYATHTFESTGTFPITLTVTDDAGNTHQSTEYVTVEASPQQTGPSGATDPDNDGKFEDIDGDGEFSIVDVQTMFRDRNTAAIQNNPDQFDFNGDGDVSIADIQRLFSMLQQ